MGFDWSTVQRQHVVRACELVLAGEHRPRVSAKGLFVVFQEQRLPAKHIARLAYCLASNLPLDTNLKFASGEGTLSLFQKLGFNVARVSGLSPNVEK